MKIKSGDAGDGDDAGDHDVAGDGDVAGDRDAGDYVGDEIEIR